MSTISFDVDDSRHFVRTGPQETSASHILRDIVRRAATGIVGQSHSNSRLPRRNRRVNRGNRYVARRPPLEVRCIL